jgi:hypothetical protein
VGNYAEKTGHSNNYSGADNTNCSHAYLAPTLWPTTTLTGVAVAVLIPDPVGTAVAVITTAPRIDGLHEQDVVKLEPDPVANLFLHPAMTTPEDLKVTFEATVTSALIVEAFL